MSQCTPIEKPSLDAVSYRVSCETGAGANSLPPKQDRNPDRAFCGTRGFLRDGAVPKAGVPEPEQQRAVQVPGAGAEERVRECTGAVSAHASAQVLHQRGQPFQPGTVL